MPAQPPFLTPTRTPAIGFSARAKISLMRVAAASLRRMTCNLGLGFVVDGVAIVFLVESNHLICGPTRAGTQLFSPHVQGDPRFVRHAALIPRRGPPPPAGRPPPPPHAPHPRLRQPPPLPRPPAPRSGHGAR